MKKVVILMSTYNGEQYLREQLDSILSQTYKNIEILIRDDGSTDSTISIIDEYKKRQAHLSYYQGENLKPAKSFMDLLSKASDADYYAFCDQDDVWKPEKLETAIFKLENLPPEDPNIYIGALTFVDKDLNIIGHRKDTLYKLTFAESWIYCVATGCTMVMNNVLKDLINSIRVDNIQMHDIWAFRMCLAYGGNAIYDYTPYILYRQHGNNVVGANTSIRRKWIERIKKTCHLKQGERWLMSLEMKKHCIDSIPEPQRKVLNTIVNYKSSFVDKMTLLFGKEYQTNNKYQNFIFRCAVLLNRF